MAEEKIMRLSQVARKLNVGRNTIIDHLADKGFDIDSSPNAKITSEQYAILAKEFADSAHDKEEAHELTIGGSHTENLVIEPNKHHEKKHEEEQDILIKGAGIEETVVEEKLKENKEPDTVKTEAPKLQGIKVLGKIDVEGKKPKKETPKKETKTEEKVVQEKVVDKKKEEVSEDKKKEVPEDHSVEEIKKETTTPIEKTTTEEKPENDKGEQKVIAAKADKLKGLNVLGKIDLPTEKKKAEPVASSDKRGENKKKKRPRKRISTPGQDNSHHKGKTSGKNEKSGNNKGGFKSGGKRQKIEKEEPTDKEIQEKIKATLAKLSGGGTGKKQAGAKYRREKRSAVADAREEQLIQEQEESKILKVTEFISANDLASMMDVSVNEVISTCMGLGMFVSINQRLDAESITVIADEFGYNVEFASEEDDLDVAEEKDTEESLEERAPIVTIMGHVDHGKTSLLDYIREAKIAAGEAGGITQHIGAYDVMTESGHKIAFLDTPGHEAFTAMRARGAKVTDIVIIVVAADDDVMPQTKEAINHAQVAGVPIIIAINKIDRPQSNPDKIKESLSKENVLVEDWGGKYQCQEISAKTGQGVEDLLEKVLLEAELLELKANHNKRAVGTVIEATLDKGRGYLTTILVQSGTLKVGNVLLAGAFYGRVKAMYDHKGKTLDEAGPSTPVLMLGLNGAPQAGDKFNVMESDREAREIATKREQILREQSIRTKKHITLDEIGRRLAIGSFKELNVIVKGDVDGSVEALSDSLLKLSTDEVQVNIIHKAVGQISESDVLLASASDAVIVGFQVRPSGGAKKISETEEIEIRLYSVIYDAINDVKDAMEGMLAPTVEEVIVGNVEVREVFKITKVGTVAGCMVIDGYVKRNNPIRLIRDGIVVYAGEMGQLKRFKDDVQEVKKGYECGLSIKGFNDIKIGDVVESYEEREVKRKL
ncbi:MAG: translation initiation factor IF-2 [Cyclobacteriaceae bacterium]|nr:translation initiation factor IF-2 [Cyclobacteriaceae bacterium]